MNFNKLYNIFISRVILRAAGTGFSLYTASTVSTLITQAGSGINAGLLTTVIQLLTVSITYFILRGIAGYFVSKRETKTVQELRFTLYRKFFSLSPANIYLHQDAGELLECFRDDFGTVVGMYTSVLPSLIMSTASYVVYLVYAGTQSLTVTVIMFALSQLQIIVPLVIEPKFYDNYAEDRECEARCTNAEIEAHTAFRDIRVFGLQKWYRGYLAKFQDEAARVGKKFEYLFGMGTSLETLVNSVIQYGTYLLIGVFVFMDYIPMESAVLLLYISRTTYSSIMEAYEKIIDFSENRMAKERLAKITESQPQLPDSESDLRHCGCLTMENCKVTADDKIILNLPEFTAAPNRTNVIVGVNGSGKSTLLKVLAGMIIPDEGRFTTTGQPSSVFYIPQDDLKLQETPLELSSTDRFIELCTRFGLTDEMLSRPIQTLSGGECKKVYLALAFSTDDGWILLDEPSNNLDYTAKVTLAELLAERNGKAVIITHDEDLLKLIEEKQSVSVTHVEKTAEVDADEE